MHLFCETPLWLTYSEFVDPGGNISRGNGQTSIRFTDNGVRNERWVDLGGQTIRNDYVIHPSKDNLYYFESENSALGRQTGTGSCSVCLSIFFNHPIHRPRVYVWR